MLQITSNEEFYSFHNQIKEAVEYYGEDFLNEDTLIEIIGTEKFPVENSRIYRILVYMCGYKLISIILNHETNSWDNELTETFSAFAKSHYFDEAQMLYIARSIASAIGMKVDLGIDTLNPPSKRKGNHIYTSKELKDKIVFLKSPDTTCHIHSVRIIKCPYECFEFQICIKADEGGYDRSIFGVNIIVRRLDNSIVLAQSSGTLYDDSVSSDDSYRLTIKLNRKLYSSDHVARIEIFTTKEIIRNRFDIDF